MANVSSNSSISEHFPAYAGDIAWQVGPPWELIKLVLVVPLLRVCVYICLAMSIMMFMERLYMGVVVLLVKLFWNKPDKRYTWEPIKDDVEIGTQAFPMVLVQIPMFNEKEVYNLSISAACNLSWPTNRLLIQVLDDSTDPAVKEMIEKECIKWRTRGINIVYHIRETRGGFKAGSLKEGLKCSYVKECEYVVIFDADFQPEPNFLRQSVPFLIHNKDIALVQGRWRFVNADDCLLTRMQEMTLDYHFKVEQEVGSATHAFFGFNGTGGIWRISAISEAGGWNDTTTVEDMDLAVRASLKGWKFLYLGDLQVKSELPSSFRAFRSQQHRWSCGPTNLFRKMFMNIITNKKISHHKRFYMIYSFFFVRKIVAHIFTFFFFCIVLPLTVLVPEVYVPKWGSILLPCIVTALNSVGTPRSLYLLFYWVLFENVMSFHRTKASIIGLLETKRVHEWIVTEKLGDSQRNRPNTKSVTLKKSLLKIFGQRIYFQELGIAMFLLICGFYDLFYGENYYFTFIFLQVIAFTITGFGFIGLAAPS